MARKKEPDLEYKNKNRIVKVATKLFLKKGVDSTTMSDIAKAVGMSKSTLYIYFKSKEEVKKYLSLEAMVYFYEQLKINVTEDLGVKERFFSVCDVLVNFKRKYPLNFSLLIEEICVDEEVLKKDEIFRKIYETGEAVNHFLYKMFGGFICNSDEKDIFIQIMSVWAQVYGIVTLADNKEKYIKMTAGITKEEFLESTFMQLFNSFDWKDV